MVLIVDYFPWFNLGLLRINYFNKKHLTKSVKCIFKDYCTVHGEKAYHVGGQSQ